MVSVTFLALKLKQSTINLMSDPKSPIHPQFRSKRFLGMLSSYPEIKLGTSGRADELILTM